MSPRPTFYLRSKSAVRESIDGELEARVAKTSLGLRVPFFLGPPLVLDGELYVLAEVRGDLSLYVPGCRNRRRPMGLSKLHTSGPCRWMKLGGSRGATPSYSDGVLICPTSSCAVVAVDASTRSLIWGYQYPRDPRQKRIRTSRRFNPYYASSQRGNVERVNSYNWRRQSSF